MKDTRRFTHAVGKLHLHRHVYLSLVAILIGILAGYGALIFRYVIKMAQYGFYQNTNDVLTFHSAMPLWL